ncbi:MAG TPA: chorismate synthase, partial [Armatimonadetes bacterium]|nr:chorismate synthase [Armatimonadota bacterium]
MASRFGTLFSLTTFGESHGGGVGVVVDGCPPGLPLAPEDIQVELDRRRPGQSLLTTQRRESDLVSILSGVDQGHTLGTPIGLLVPNQDAKSHDYAQMHTVYRPSHADYTYDAKYGRRAVAGGGRASARETIGRVAAGAIARKLLALRWGVEIVAYVAAIGEVTADVAASSHVTREQVEQQADGT